MADSPSDRDPISPGAEKPAPPAHSHPAKKSPHHPAPDGQSPRRLSPSPRVSRDTAHSTQGFRRFRTCLKSNYNPTNASHTNRTHPSPVIGFHHLRQLPPP